MGNVLKRSLVKAQKYFLFLCFYSGSFPYVTNHSGDIPIISFTFQSGTQGKVFFLNNTLFVRKIVSWSLIQTNKQLALTLRKKKKSF